MMRSMDTTVIIMKRSKRLGYIVLTEPKVQDTIRIKKRKDS